MAIRTYRSTMNDAISIKEVAGYFRVSTRTIREWVERDDAFPRPFKKFGTLRFRRSEVEEYWAKNTISNSDSSNHQSNEVKKSKVSKKFFSNE